jgi:hypothetical protein
VPKFSEVAVRRAAREAVAVKVVDHMYLQHLMKLGRIVVIFLSIESLLPYLMIPDTNNFLDIEIIE